MSYAGVGHESEVGDEIGRKPPPLQFGLRKIGKKGTHTMPSDGLIELNVDVEDESEKWHRLPFLIDTCANVTILPPCGSIQTAGRAHSTDNADRTRPVMHGDQAVLGMDTLSMLNLSPRKRRCISHRAASISGASSSHPNNWRGILTSATMPTVNGRPSHQPQVSSEI
jgi:hypothetical protein